VKVNEKVVWAASVVLFHSPLAVPVPEVSVPLVVECPMLEALVHMTVSPELIEIEVGLKVSVLGPMVTRKVAASRQWTKAKTAAIVASKIDGFIILKAVRLK
jgi:hypothetical protein